MNGMRMLVYSLAACGLAVIFFAYQQELILIQPYGWQQLASAAQEQPLAYTLWLHANNNWKHEQERCLDPQDTNALLYHIMQRWLHYAYREGVINKKINVQSTMLAHDNKHLFISFDRNPFRLESSTHQRMLLIKSLLKTVAQQPSVTHVRILVQHAALEDPYIDFTINWPVSLVHNSA
jgi:hypothetical protein